MHVRKGLIMMGSLFFLDQVIKAILVYKYTHLIDVCISILGGVGIHPKFNDQINWYNVKFNLGITKNVYLGVGIIVLVVMGIMFMYCKYEVYGGKRYKDKWKKYIILVAIGTICGMSDQLFFGNTLDYIEVSNIGIFDLKDIYIVVGLIGLSIHLIIEEIKYKNKLEKEFKKIPLAIKHFIGHHNNIGK